MFTATKSLLGILEITTTNARGSKDVPYFGVTQNRDGIVYVKQIEVQNFEFNHTLKYKNILRKWSKLCISLDFDQNTGQVGFNGRVSPLISDPGKLSLSCY